MVYNFQCDIFGIYYPISSNLDSAFLKIGNIPEKISFKTPSQIFLSFKCSVCILPRSRNSFAQAKSVETNNLDSLNRALRPYVPGVTRVWLGHKRRCTKRAATTFHTAKTCKIETKTHNLYITGGVRLARMPPCARCATKSRLWSNHWAGGERRTHASVHGDVGNCA